MAAFLEVITRCCKRPKMLAKNKAAFERQTCQDFTQTFLVDDVGRGKVWAEDNLRAHVGSFTGAYIWLLDDDDLCTRDSLVGELKAIVEAYTPDVIMVRMDHGPLGILPPDDLWRQRPQPGRIGGSSVIVRREVWHKHGGAWREGVYHADFEFIDSLFRDNELSIYWHDVVASKVQRISWGNPEGTMKVRALKSFVGSDGNKRKYRIEVGQEFDLPPGTNWLEAGFVEPVEIDLRETAVSQAAKGRKKRGVTDGNLDANI